MTYILFLILGIYLPAGAVSADAVVITNSSIAPGTVNPETIRKIYSGQISKWPDNTRIIVTTITQASFHEEFLKKYVEKSKSQFTATWKKLMFSGMGVLPTNFETMDQLIDFVSKHKSAIGYVTDDTKLRDVSIQK